MNPFLIVIPAFNEETNIGQVIEGLLAIKLPADILIVNDGSLDLTAAIAACYPVTVLSHPYNLGYGAALQTGFKYASLSGYQYVLQFDGDGQHDPNDLQYIMEDLQKNDVEIVIGSRYLNGQSTFRLGLVKKMAVCFFSWLIYLVTDLKISDPTSGLRGISQTVFHYYAVSDRFPADFPDADILIQMILRNYRVREVSARMKNRESGVSMHAGIKPLFYMMKISISIMIVLLHHKLTKQVQKYE